jgi:RNA polymerase sigma-70 factor (ECF subfamily)
LAKADSNPNAQRDQEDAEIIRRCRRGESDAWAELVQRYRLRMFHLAYQFVGDFAEAEDLVQEIFLKLCNYLIDRYRRHHRQRKLLQGGDDALRTIPDASPTPVKSVERRERAEILRRGLQELPETLRKAVVLRDVRGLSYEEISDELGVPVGTVKSRINRGRCELAAALQADLRELQKSGKPARGWRA